MTPEERYIRFKAAREAVDRVYTDYCCHPDEEDDDAFYRFMQHMIQMEEKLRLASQKGKNNE